MSAYIFATSGVEPDRQFHGLSALARHLVSLAGGRPLVFMSARMARGGLPQGACVSVRVRDGSDVRGRLLGFALMPHVDADDGRFVTTRAKVLEAACLGTRRAAIEREAA